MSNNNMSIRAQSVILLILAFALLGCTESQREEASGKGAIRGVNSLVDSFDANFLIEERSLGILQYKDSSSLARFDDLTYAFNFDIAVAGQTDTQRIASVTKKIIKDMDYVFVLAGSVATPQVLIWEHAERQWAGTETVFEMAFGHASPQLGPVDVYYALTGTAPVLGEAIGTIAFGERLDEREFESDQYEIILTAPGDPATVLFSSLPFTNPAAGSNISLILDVDPSRSGTVNVRQLVPAGNTFEMPDSRFPPTAQVINTSFGAGNIDLVIDNDFASPPAVANLPFGTVSADVNVPTIPATYSYTPPGSTTVLLEEEIAVGVGARIAIILYGKLGTLATTRLTSNRRSISTEAQIRVSNAGFNSPQVDVYLSPDDTALEDLSPILSSLPLGVASAYQRVAGDIYELTVTTATEKTVLAGPLSIDMANGDIVEIVILDTADPAVAGLLQYSNL